MPMEFIVSSQCIIAPIELMDSGAVEKIISEIMELEEGRFIEGFHQKVQKKHEKSWHEKHIK
jgi:hypothetical protein